MIGVGIGGGRCGGGGCRVGRLSRRSLLENERSLRFHPGKKVCTARAQWKCDGGVDGDPASRNDSVKWLSCRRVTEPNERSKSVQPARGESVRATGGKASHEYRISRKLKQRVSACTMSSFFRNSRRASKKSPSLNLVLEQIRQALQLNNDGQHGIESLWALQEKYIENYYPCNKNPEHLFLQIFR